MQRPQYSNVWAAHDYDNPHNLPKGALIRALTAPVHGIVLLKNRCVLLLMLVLMHRGFYRSSTGKWYIPESVKCSAASRKDSRSGGMRSELKAGNKEEFELSFDVPSQLAPLFLAFELQSGGSAELNRMGQRFAVPVGMSAGKIASMGETMGPIRLLSYSLSCHKQSSSTKSSAYKANAIFHCKLKEKEAIMDRPDYANSCPCIGTSLGPEMTWYAVSPLSI